MKENKKLKKLLATTALSGVVASMSAQAADVTPQTYLIAMSGKSAKHGAEKKCGAGKCAPGKCGAGKCGGKVEKKAAEKKCGAGKCGGEKKKKHAKKKGSNHGCGAGQCG